MFVGILGSKINLNTLSKSRMDVLFNELLGKYNYPSKALFPVELQ